MSNFMHYWVGSKSGYVMSSNKVCPIRKPRKGDKMSYMGFTADGGWPKRMSTGRLLYKPNSKSRKKTKKYRKLFW